MKRFWFIGILAVNIISLASQAQTMGDAEKGGKLFNSGFLLCYACHSLEAGETKVGPTLGGIFGRKAGSAEGFKQYSKAMVNSEIIWDEDTLNKFLANPKTFIPGNKMKFSYGIEFRGVSSSQHRADLIVYLKTNIQAYTLKVNDIVENLRSHGENIDDDTLPHFSLLPYKHVDQCINRQEN